MRASVERNAFGSRFSLAWNEPEPRWRGRLRGLVPAQRRDDSRWPLAVLTPTREHVVQLLHDDVAWLRALLERRAPFAVTIDLRDAAVLNAGERAIWARFIEEATSSIRLHLAGVAFVADSPVLRGMLTAIFWVRPLPTEHVVVETLHDATVWCDARIRAR